MSPPTLAAYRSRIFSYRAGSKSGCSIDAIASAARSNRSGRLWSALSIRAWESLSWDSIIRPESLIDSTARREPESRPERQSARRSARLRSHLHSRTWDVLLTRGDHPGSSRPLGLSTATLPEPTEGLFAIVV